MFSLKSKITQKILNLFFLDQGRKFYVNQIAKRIKEDSSNVHKKLLELKQEGILSDESKKKERFFFLNKDYPFLEEYKKIVLQTLSPENKLKQELKGLEGLQSLYIFGPYVEKGKGELQILTVGTHSAEEISKRLLELQEEMSEEISHAQIVELDQEDPDIKEAFSKKYIQVF